MAVGEPDAYATWRVGTHLDRGAGRVARVQNGPPTPAKAQVRSRSGARTRSTPSHWRLSRTIRKWRAAPRPAPGPRVSDSGHARDSDGEPPDLGIEDDHAQYAPDRSPFGRPPRESLVARTFPVSQQLPKYPKRGLRADLVAGVTVAALAVPAAMAYASLAGVTPVAGLYALLLPAVAYAFLGSSRAVGGRTRRGDRGHGRRRDRTARGEGIVGLRGVRRAPRTDGRRHVRRRVSAAPGVDRRLLLAGGPRRLHARRRRRAHRGTARQAVRRVDHGTGPDPPAGRVLRRARRDPMAHRAGRVHLDRRAGGAPHLVPQGSGLARRRGRRDRGLRDLRPRGPRRERGGHHPAWVAELRDPPCRVPRHASICCRPRWASSRSGSPTAS